MTTKSCHFLPANTTSLIQPLNQGVLEKVKHCYKCDLLLHMLNVEDSASNSVSVEDLSKTLNIEDTVFMSAKCWDEAGEITIVGSWNELLLSISTSTDEQQDLSEDIETLLDKHNIPTQERQEWIAADVNDPGYHEYTEDEIIKIAQEEVSEVQEEEYEEEIDEPMVMHTQACEAAETLLKYLEQ